MHFKVNVMKVLAGLIIIIPILGRAFRNGLFLFLLAIAAFIAFSYLKQMKFKVALRKDNIIFDLWALTIVMILYAIINSTINGITSDTLIRLIQLFTCFFVLLVASQYKWKRSDYLFIKRMIRIIVFIALAMWPFSGYRTNYYNAMFSHANALGGLLFCYFGLFLMDNNKKSILDSLTLLVMLLLLYFSNSRSALIAAVIYFFFTFLFLWLKRWRFRWVFFVVLVGCILFPMVYMWLFESDFREALNLFSWQFFRKRFFSGRQYIWGPLLFYIRDNFLFGLGLAVSPEDLLNNNWSAHNWYLQSLVQMGISGLLLVGSSLACVWNCLYKMRNYVVCRKTSAFMLGMLLWQCFEVSITQNNFSEGILVWLILGMGTNKSFIANINPAVVVTKEKRK